MLIAFLYLYNKSGGSFAVLDYHKLPLPLNAQILLFIAFLMAFRVKWPMWPVHTWLPDAHVEAPTGGSAVLAAILLKLGRTASSAFRSPSCRTRAITSGFHDHAVAHRHHLHRPGGARADRHEKADRVLVHLAHGLRDAGFFVFNAYGMEGGLVQMISHGFVSAALFLCVGVLYDRMHSRNIADYGGVVNTMPRFAALMMLFAMAKLRVAGHLRLRRGVHGDRGAMKFNFWIAFLAGTTLSSVPPTRCGCTSA